MIQPGDIIHYAEPLDVDLPRNKQTIREDVVLDVTYRGPEGIQVRTKRIANIINGKRLEVTNGGCGYQLDEDFEVVGTTNKQKELGL